MILYKYRGNSEYTDKIFLDKKVWLSNAMGLNDPFECKMQEIAKDWIDIKVKELKQAHIEGFLAPFIFSKKYRLNNLSIKETEVFLKRFKKKSFEEKYKTVRDIYKRRGTELSNPDLTFSNIDNQLNEVGIFSLSEDCENILMWAHYADSSRGVAIGFDVDTNATHIKIRKVRYSEDLPVLHRDGLLLETKIYHRGNNLQRIAFSDPTFEDVITTKSIQWETEREWRYIEPKWGAFSYPGEIKEVVFGINCPEEVRKHYLNLVNSNITNSVDFYEIKSLKNTNKIEKIKYDFF